MRAQQESFPVLSVAESSLNIIDHIPATQIMGELGKVGHDGGGGNGVAGNTVYRSGSTGRQHTGSLCS
ncbi:MAG: hypothetical protein LBG58_12450 [Planctomycetaceae bacterium]|nr:hypothetical protein [Planctomycetaceae bacterium]